MSGEITLLSQDGQVRRYSHTSTPRLTYHWYGSGRTVAVVHGARDIDAITVGSRRSNTASESDVFAGIARWVREHPEHTREQSQ